MKQYLQLSSECQFMEINTTNNDVDGSLCLSWHIGLNLQRVKAIGLHSFQLTIGDPYEKPKYHKGGDALTDLIYANSRCDSSIQCNLISRTLQNPNREICRIFWNPAELYADLRNNKGYVQNYYFFILVERF